MLPYFVNQEEAQELKLHFLTWLFLILIPLISFLWIVFYAKIKQTRSKLPPGPPRLPIIGNLHQIGALPHHSLKTLSDKYGSIMLLQLGQVPTLVVSSAEMAKEIMKTQDIVFCSRPPLTAWRKLSYGGLDLAFAPYNEYWKQARKISMLELFHPNRVQMFRPIREEEVDALVQTIHRSSSYGPLNLTEMFLSLLNNVTCREVFGKRFSSDGECGRSRFHEMIDETIALMGGFCAADFFPSMKWLNVLTGLQSRLDRNFHEMDEFLEKEIEARRAHGGDERLLEHNDFASVLLQLENDPTLGIPLTREHIKALLMITFIAGTDTAAASLVWGMTELIKHPRIMEKAQGEVRRLVREKGKVEESDLHHLNYLKLVVKESLRLHPPGPLLLPRESREDSRINGYDIPAKTRVYINAWAIGRDPSSWEDPEAFMPERFEGSSVDYKGQHFQFVPFGGGRRVCPGISLAATTMELALANLLYTFDWTLPNGMTIEEIDMSESFGIVINKKAPLLLMANPTRTI